MAKMTLNRLSILIATGVLLLLLVGLSVMYFQNREQALPVSQSNEKTEPVRTPKSDVKQLSPEEKEQKLVEREALRTGQAVEELKQVMNQPEAQIARETERVAEMPPEKIMSELVGKKRRLERMKSEHVEKITDFVNTTMSVENKRETEVIRTVTPDKFDADSAQISDCRREEKGDGTYRYFATLVDADGNSIEVELYGKEGEQTWRTMKMVNGSPIMGALYRSTVMPLLDRKMSKKKEEDTVPTNSNDSDPNDSARSNASQSPAPPSFQ